MKEACNASRRRMQSLQLQSVGRKHDMLQWPSAEACSKHEEHLEHAQVTHGSLVFLGPGHLHTIATVRLEADRRQLTLCR